MNSSLNILLAQAIDNTDAALAAVKEAVGALQNGYLNVGIGMIILLLTWAFSNFIMPKMKKSLIPLITVIVATIVAAGQALYAVPQDATWWVYVEQIALGAIVMGGTSNGLWSMVFKHVLPKAKLPAGPSAEQLEDMGEGLAAGIDTSKPKSKKATPKLKNTVSKAVKKSVKKLTKSAKTTKK